MDAVNVSAHAVPSRGANAGTGQVLPLMALVLVGLLAMVALVIEPPFSHYLRKDANCRWLEARERDHRCPDTTIKAARSAA